MPRIGFIGWRWGANIMITAGVYSFYARHRTDIIKIFDFDQLALLTLSVLQSRPLFNRLYLFTDEVGFNMLVNELDLPFDLVSKELEDFMPQSLNSIWALAKLKTYSLMIEPFCHLDNDVVLYKSLPDKILAAPLIAQSKYTDPNAGNLRHLIHYVPDDINKSLLTDAPIYHNAGIFGGNNWEFYRDLWKIITETILHPDNRGALYLTRHDDRRYNILNQFFEEIYMGALAHTKGIPVQDLFKEHANESEAIELGYTHLAGGMKKNPYWNKRVRAKLLTLHEKSYYNLVNVCKRLNVPINNI